VDAATGDNRGLASIGRDRALVDLTKVDACMHVGGDSFLGLGRPTGLQFVSRAVPVDLADPLPGQLRWPVQNN
jgi:hypothetical protein